MRNVIKRKNIKAEVPEYPSLRIEKTSGNIYLFLSSGKAVCFGCSYDKEQTNAYLTSYSRSSFLYEQYLPFDGEITLKN